MEAKIFDRTDYSEEEYFELFDQFERKIEYHAGRIQMMAGALGAHNDIVMNMTLSLGRNRNKCKPHNNDQAIHIPAFRRYIYPDLSFSCGGPKYDDKNKRFLLNPALVVEVVSGESKTRDYESKFKWYFSLPSVREYIVISSLKMDVKSYLRTDEQRWTMQSLWEPDQTLTVETLSEEITLRQIYDDVVLLEDDL